jgi:hypothetical protein
MGIVENILGTKEQNETAQKNLDKQATEGSKLAKFLGGKPAEAGMMPPEQAGMAPPERAGMRPAKKEEFNLHKTVKKAASEDMKKGGSVSSASKRADGCAIKGKTRA